MLCLNDAVNRKVAFALLRAGQLGQAGPQQILPAKRKTVWQQDFQTGNNNNQTSTQGKE